MATAPTPLLEVRDLAVRYTRRRGAQPVVQDVSLQVEEGQILALVGESGSGKTTVARAVVGLVRPRAGELRFEGRDLTRFRSRDQHRSIQMVFQDPRSSLNPRMTVEEIIAEGWRVHPGTAPADRGAALLELLDQVGLPEAVRRRRPREISGGQCQRVSIARALAVAPRLIVCDEAVSALDVSVQAQILQLLSDLRRTRRLSLLFITHDLGVVRQLADRCAVMQSGRIVEQGATDDIFENPTDPYTVELLDAALDIRD